MNFVTYLSTRVVHDVLARRREKAAATATAALAGTVAEGRGDGLGTGWGVLSGHGEARHAVDDVGRAA